MTVLNLTNKLAMDLLKLTNTLENVEAFFLNDLYMLVNFYFFTTWSESFIT